MSDTSYEASDPSNKLPYDFILININNIHFLKL